MQDIILFGMQGSGKGTQSQVLASRFSYRIFETGGALRAIAADGGELGQRVKALMDAGNLVPTSVVIEIVADFLKKTPADQHVIFDGIPRSEEQRVLFDAAVAQAGRTPLAVYISLTEDEAMRRLSGRKTCGSCGAIYGHADNLAVTDACPKCGVVALKIRSDDTEEAIRRRLDLYAAETLPVIEMYRSAGRLVEIEGSKEPAAVTEAIAARIA